MSRSDAPLGGPGSWDNPWPSWGFPGLGNICKAASFLWRQPGRPSEAELDQHAPMMVPTVKSRPPPEDGEGVEVTWVGHATCLVRIGGYAVLTDAVFGKHCSPVPLSRTARIRPPAITLDELPPIHAVVYSHDHYDHMDLPSAKILEQNHHPHWFIPHGNEKHLTSCNIAPDRIHSLKWWESSTMPSSDPRRPGLVFTLVPAQHWSKRALSGRNSVLWGGWAVATQTGGSSFYFSGDTGFTRETPPSENWKPEMPDPTIEPALSDPTVGEAFRRIGERCGPFDVSLIPIGAYCPRDMLCPQHVDPTEAVAVHQRVRTAFSVGIHWGTFILSCEGVFEPPVALAAAAAKAGLGESEFTAPHHGLTRLYKRGNAAPLVVMAP